MRAAAADAATVQEAVAVVVAMQADRRRLSGSPQKVSGHGAIVERILL